MWVIGWQKDRMGGEPIEVVVICNGQLFCVPAGTGMLLGKPEGSRMCSKENTEVPGGGENGKWAAIIHTYIIYAAFPFMAILLGLLDHKD
jgi:hypothetical protein